MENFWEDAKGFIYSTKLSRALSEFVIAFLADSATSQVVNCSTCAITAFGYETETEMLHKHINELILEVPDAKDKGFASLSKDKVVRCLRKDGSVFPAIVRFAEHENHHILILLLQLHAWDT